jgi:3-oxoisoapionate kinase
MKQRWAWLPGRSKSFPESEVLLAFYGDDFTGSTDSMEALTLAGLETVLFLEPPNLDILHERFPGLRCYGIAGVSRSMSPEDMESELRPILEHMRSMPTRVVHYKICSTFDSSPQVGSIGFAMDLGREVFGNDNIPLLVGAPILKRYTLFGNHFATVQGETYRLDRHPTMARHPITPMDEGDLRLHLRKQTQQTVGLLDILALDGDITEVDQRYAALKADNDIILIDVLDETRLRVAGHLMWNDTTANQQFVVGSSGVEYALTATWKEDGYLYDAQTTLASPGPAKQIVVFSGSCSPVTQSQIDYAAERGFKTLRVPVDEFLNPVPDQAFEREFFNKALRIIRGGDNLILFTAMGPDDHNVKYVQDSLRNVGATLSNTGEFIGRKLGQMARELIRQTDLRRIIVAGGDTCGYAARELGIFALKMLSPVAPGGPLCMAFSEDSSIDGLQIVLKGGQVGRENYFLRVLHGSDA